MSAAWPSDESTVHPQQDRYYAAVWFLERPAAESDVLIGLHQDPGKPWQCRWRIRFYSEESENPWDGKDEKEYYVRELPGLDEAAALAWVNDFVKMLTSVVGEHGIETEVHQLLLRTADVEEISGQIMSQPWAHAKEQTE